MVKKKKSKGLTILVFILIGAAAGFFGVQTGAGLTKMVSPGHMIALILLFVPSYFLAVAIHEGGHALAGSFMQFDFRMYVVGPFLWTKEESGWKFKWNKNVNLSGGFVICLPSDDNNMAKRFSIYALGGPTASLILSALAYGGFKLLSTLNSAAADLIGLLLALTGFLSLFIFIVTIIPLRIGGFYTDGARALRFMRGGDTSMLEILFMKIFTSSAGGIRPRLLKKDELGRALSLATKLNSPTKVYLFHYLHQAAFDEGNFDDAEKYIQEYLAGIEDIPKGFRGGVFLDAAFFYAFARKDLDQAELYWKQYEPSAVLPKAQIYAVDAAICSLKNDSVGLNEKVKSALGELPNVMDRGWGISMREKLMQLKSTN